MRQFQQSMKLGIFSPVYLFFGNEPFLIDKGLDLLRESALGNDTFNLDIFDGETSSPKDVAEAAMTSPFFGERRLVVVKNIPWLARKRSKVINEEDDEDESAPGVDINPLLEYLEEPNPSAILALTMEGNAEKSRKLVKMVQKVGRLVECSAYKGEELLVWLNQEVRHRGYQAERRALDLLILACGNNMMYLNNELDKLCLYCRETKNITAEAAHLMVSQTSALSIFDLLDAVAMKDGVRSISLFRKMTKEGEPAQKILAMMGKQFRDMLGVKELASQGLKAREIADRLNLRSVYMVEKYIRYARCFSSQTLLSAMEQLLNADVANKSGQGELDNLLEIAILRICGSM